MNTHGGAQAPGTADDDGLTITDVAALLGISKDAVRRRLRAGQLDGHHVVTSHGPAWCVHLDTHVEAHHGGGTVPPESTHGGDMPTTVALVELLRDREARIDSLTSENRQLAEAAAVWQERARVLADQLALAAPQQPVGTSGALGPTPPITGPSASWWRSWWPW
jgi:hypothetical protein